MECLGTEVGQDPLRLSQTMVPQVFRVLLKRSQTSSSWYGAKDSITIGGVEPFESLVSLEDMAVGSVESQVGPVESTGKNHH